MPLPGTEDVHTFRVWTHFAAIEGVAGLYGSGGWPPDQRHLTLDHETTVVDYPPMALYYLQGVGTLVRNLLPVRSPLVTRVAIKGIAMAASAIVAVLVWVAARRLGGDRAAWLAVVAYWANPIAIYHASLGSIGALAFAPAILALIAAGAGAASTSGVMLAIGVLTKPQAIFVLPGVVAQLASRPQASRRLCRAAFAAAAVAVLLLMPFVLAGTISSALHAARALTAGPLLSSATNLWWIAGAAAGGVAQVDVRETRDLVPLPFTIGWWPAGSALVGLVAWGSVAMMAWWAARRAMRDASVAAAFACAALTVQIYFVLALQVHENHLALALPLLAILTAADREYRAVLIAVSVAFGLNLAVFYDPLGGQRFVLPAMSAGMPTSLLIAVINVGVFAYHLRVFRRLTARGAVASASECQAA